ncbi:MAG TPA: hypothetical protein VHP33_21320 [Polyangiaceae bacterium]|nr:hypothetical protein [Polyangiaceae bacterium]
MVAVSLLVGCGSTDANGGAGAAGQGAGSSGAAQGGDAGAGGDGGGEAEPVPSLDGRWAMFSFEDPVGVELSEESGVLSGQGCYGGLPTPNHPEIPSTCQPLTGTASGRHVQFAFAAETYTYAANVYVSADGQRMAGAFRASGGWGVSPFSWLRIGANDGWMPRAEPASAVSLALEERSNWYELEGLVDVDGTPGRIDILGYGQFRALAGTLGAFWESEMTWNEAEQTLVAGPVPETSPELPTQLTLRFQSTALVSVDAVFPSGDTTTFQAAPFSQR